MADAMDAEGMIALFRDRVTDVYVNAWASGYGSALSAAGMDSDDAAAEAMALALQMYRDPAIRYEMEQAASRALRNEPAEPDKRLAFKFRPPVLVDARGRVWVHDFDVYYDCRSVDGLRLPVAELAEQFGPLGLPE